MNKTDLELQGDVERELAWDPKVNAAQIGVSVEHGAVALVGIVDTFAEKWAAEDATKRVAGVRAVAQDLKVKVLGEHLRTDAEIATAVEHALEWDVFIPKAVTAAVENGIVTLRGQVNWHYQRDAVERAVRYLPGVVDVSNGTTLIPEAPAVAARPAGEVKARVEAALKRQDRADVKSIHVDEVDGVVTLTGSAYSWQAVKDASMAAWAAPGVTRVIDQVKVQLTI